MVHPAASTNVSYRQQRSSGGSRQTDRPQSEGAIHSLDRLRRAVSAFGPLNQTEKKAGVDQRVDRVCGVG